MGGGMPMYAPNMNKMPFGNPNPNQNPNQSQNRTQNPNQNFQKGPNPNQQGNRNTQPNKVNTPTTNTNQVINEQPDLKYLDSLEDDSARKDYLGEFIFKKIENHDFTIKKALPIDTIGKITGMILGIEDINEIIDISKSNDQLSLRMQEALELLESAN